MSMEEKVTEKGKETVGKFIRKGKVFKNIDL